ncbi:hypothetical protein DNHGIG_01740 [Collibacillus ludicampi]|jgi:hypothetical protein|uniref:Uncharacterized protein n=1 Tax=Collibacillus ludicampi TaxID=2771369 RepID=A0AAV4LA29_9BACL|nr:hypothetical protein [Collibacillus ludicampi]GIM44625.1 hypothetical protein DNHGIG_01740 [Collibacillus ludicampi]
MGFFYNLLRFVKIVLITAMTILFFRALLFPNALDMLVLFLLSFVLLVMFISRPL